MNRVMITAAVVAALTAAVPNTKAQETGNVCVRDYQAGAVCTANDVRLDSLTPVSVVEDCTTGTIGSATVIFEALVSAAGSPDRFDIGIFIALDGGDALTGDNCLHDFLEPPLTATPTYGDANVDMIQDIDGPPWLDNDGDSCGDIATNTQVLKTLIPVTIACVDTDMNGWVDLDTSVSWDNNANTVCSTVSDAFPGTNSKCSHSRLDLFELLPVPVELQSFSVE